MNRLTILTFILSSSLYSGTFIGVVTDNSNGTPVIDANIIYTDCLLYTSPSPRDLSTSRMPSSA